MSEKSMPVEGKVVETSRADGRKRQENRRARRRGAINERDILRVDGISPEFTVRWVREDTVHRRLTQDWDLVSWDEIENVGDLRANSPSPTDSRVIIRSGGENLVLMKKYKDWYKADKAEEQKAVTDIERQMRKSYGKQIQEDGTYGSIKIGD